MSILQIKRQKDGYSLLRLQKIDEKANYKWKGHD